MEEAGEAGEAAGDEDVEAVACTCCSMGAGLPTLVLRNRWRGKRATQFCMYPPSEGRAPSNARRSTGVAGKDCNDKTSDANMRRSADRAEAIEVIEAIEVTVVARAAVIAVCATGGWRKGMDDKRLSRDVNVQPFEGVFETFPRHQRFHLSGTAKYSAHQ